MNIKPIIKIVHSIFVLTCFVLLQTTFVHAEEGMKDKGKKWNKEKMEERMGEINKQLGVTPEQEQKLKEHREKSRAQMESFRGRLKEKREALRLEIEKSDFNEAQAKAIHNELKSLMNQKEDIHLESILEVRKILTQEQFKKFMDMKKDHKGFGKEGKNWKHDKRKHDDEEEK